MSPLDHLDLLLASTALPGHELQPSSASSMKLLRSRTRRFSIRRLKTQHYESQPDSVSRVESPKDAKLLTPLCKPLPHDESSALGGTNAAFEDIEQNGHCKSRLDV